MPPETPDSETPREQITLKVRRLSATRYKLTGTSHHGFSYHEHGGIMWALSDRIGHQFTSSAVTAEGVRDDLVKSLCEVQHITGRPLPGLSPLRQRGEPGSAFPSVRVIVEEGLIALDLDMDDFVITCPDVVTYTIKTGRECEKGLRISYRIDMSPGIVEISRVRSNALLSVHDDLLATAVLAPCGTFVRFGRPGAWSLRIPIDHRGGLGEARITASRHASTRSIENMVRLLRHIKNNGWER